MKQVIYMDEEDIYNYNKIIEYAEKYKKQEIEFFVFQEMQNNFWNKYIPQKYATFAGIPLTIDIKSKIISTFMHQSELYKA